MNWRWSDLGTGTRFYQNIVVLILKIMRVLGRMLCCMQWMQYQYHLDLMVILFPVFCAYSRILVVMVACLLPDRPAFIS